MPQMLDDKRLIIGCLKSVAAHHTMPRYAAIKDARKARARRQRLALML